MSDVDLPDELVQQTMAVASSLIEVIAKHSGKTCKQVIAGSLYAWYKIGQGIPFLQFFVETALLLDLLSTGEGEPAAIMMVEKACEANKNNYAIAIAGISSALEELKEEAKNDKAAGPSEDIDLTDEDNLPHAPAKDKIKTEIVQFIPVMITDPKDRN